jgi:hypothetical protein
MKLNDVEGNIWYSVMNSVRKSVWKSIRTYLVSPHALGNEISKRIEDEIQ